MLDLQLAVNFRTKIPTPPPLEAPDLSDLHFPKEVCDAVKVSSVLESVFDQVLVTATKVLMGVVCKKFENSAKLFLKL